MKPSIGRIVHYVVRTNGRHRPAIIIECGDAGTVSLHLFVDPTADGLIPFQRIVQHDQMTKDPGTWHWPEREA